MPKLEDVHKEAVKKFGEEPLTGAAEQRYRRVLGQLACCGVLVPTLFPFLPHFEVLAPTLFPLCSPFLPHFEVIVPILFPLCSHSCHSLRFLFPLCSRFVPILAPL